ncbi:MAG: redoxin domain-containing protein [Bacteroidales bacterium]|nr:redoxin domain-containing protein [Bacteroidales bacterium]
MKKWITGICAIAFLCVFVLIQSCNRKNNFSIKVTFEQLDPTPLRLYLLTESDAILVDSVHLKEKPRARLEGKVEYASIYLLKFFNDQAIYLVIHPDDKISIEVNNSTDKITYYVKGSPDSRLIKELTDKQNIVLKTIDQLSMAWETSRSDSLMLKLIDSSYSALLKEYREYTRNFITSNPNSLATILALYQNFGRKSQPLFDKYDDLDVFDFVDSSLSILYPNTEAVKALNLEVTETKEQIRHKQLIEKRVVEGILLPELEATSLAGDTIKIDHEMNMHVLLLFWATWNAFSVEELLSVNSFVKGKKMDDIQIVTLSIDSSEEVLKKFIRENSVMLPVICDFNYWDSQYTEKYAVRRIPSTILTNKAGVIIAKDLFSNELIAKLKGIEE